MSKMCDSCAFLIGTEANQTMHTTLLAQLCVDGMVPFNCHERPGYCTGWIHAVNEKHAAGDYADTHKRETFASMAEIISGFIADAAEADRQAGAKR